MRPTLISLWFILFFGGEMTLANQIPASVWIGLAWKRISFLGFDVEDCANLMASASRNNISSYCYTNYDQHLDYSVPIHVAKNNTTLLRLLRDANLPAYWILYEVQEEDLEEIASFLERLMLSKSFFILYLNNNTLPDLYNVHTFKDNRLVSMVKWPGNPTNVYFKEIFNLQGAHLKSSTLSWPPYVKVGECKNGNKNCEVSGIVTDVLLLFGRLYNFTLSFDKTTSGLWGTESYNNNSESNCDIFTNMGEIAHGAYDFSGAQWKVLPDRPCTIQYSRPCFFPDEQIFLNQKGKKSMDESLFLRPFHKDAWLAVAIVLGLLFCCSYIEKVISIDGKIRIVPALFWTFFMLIQAYYSGAMTMFFAGPSKIPFTNIPDAVKLFPKWKPALQSGMDKNFAQKLPQDISESFLNQLRTHNLFKSDMGKVLDHMNNNDQSYTFADTYLFLYQLNKRQYDLKLQNVKLKGISQTSLLLGKVSPYTRMFNKGIQQISENGVLNSFIVSKLGDLQTAHSTSESVTLGWHHLAPGILFYLATLMLIPGIVLIEKLYHWTSKIF